MEPYDVEVDQQLMEELDSFLQEINVLPVEVPEVSFMENLHVFKKNGNIVHSLNSVRVLIKKFDRLYIISFKNYLLSAIFTQI